MHPARRSLQQQAHRQQVRSNHQHLCDPDQHLHPAADLHLPAGQSDRYLPTQFAGNTWADPHVSDIASRVHQRLGLRHHRPVRARYFARGDRQARHQPNRDEQLSAGQFRLHDLLAGQLLPLLPGPRRQLDPDHHGVRERAATAQGGLLHLEPPDEKGRAFADVYDWRPHDDPASHRRQPLPRATRLVYL